MKKYFIMISICLFFFTAGCAQGSAVSYALAAPDETSGASAERQAEAQEERIFVYVCGEVQHSGVYDLPAGSRVYEAIEAAGGLLPDADTATINQAQVLTDGQQVTVHAVPDESSGGAAAESGSGKVNLNYADKEALMSLPGIGETRAQEIIDYRNGHGAFARPEDIMNISGFGEKLFEKIKNYIEV